MAKPSKKSKPTKPSRPAPKRAAARARSPREVAAAPVGAEPETLQVAPEDVDPEPGTAPAIAAAAPARKAKAPKLEPSLNTLAGYLAEQGGMQPIKDAILHLHAGDWTPDRELSVLKIVKDDDRFVIVNRNRVNLVGLVGADVEPGDVPVTEPHIGTVPDAVAAAAAAAAPAPEKVKTVGEHVEDAKARPTRVAWPHDIGSPVLLLTPGYPPKKAIISNIRNRDGLAEYDLKVGEGTTNGVHADRIGRDLEAEGEVGQLRLRIGALERHAKAGALLAQRYVSMQAEEKEMAEDLKDHRKKMEELATQLSDHARSDAGQTDLRDLVGDPDKATRGARMASKPSTTKADKPAAPPATAAAAAPAPTLADRIAKGEYLDASDLRLPGDLAARMGAAAVNRSTASTGKPQTIKPIAIGDRGDYVVVDAQDGKAVFVPVLTKKAWVERMQPTYGFPLDVPMAEAPERLTKGGKLCGTPVRVGRAVLYIGGDADAVLVRLPADAGAPDPEPRAVGKDAAAGD